MANMSRATRMLMLRNNDRNERREWPMEPENRFRDRTGREHYDNGRYAPARSRYDGGSMNYYDREPRSDGIAVWDTYRRPRSEMDEPEGRYYPPPVYREGGEPMNRIGFAMPAEMNTGYKTDASHHRMDEMEHRRGHKMAGHGEGSMAFTEEMAEEWTSGMKNKDGSRGPHWKLEDVQKVMSQRKIHKDPMEFFAVLNAVYSDYCAVAKKHGVNTMDFYVDMACAWLDDEDAHPDKATIYFHEIVR